MKALLIGREPACPLGVTYTREGPYEGVVIGSLSLSQALFFREEPVLSALAEGKPVTLYTPGLPESPRNRALGASLASSLRQMKSWGIVFTDGQQKKLITADGAREMRRTGEKPPAGAVLTPLAREILEGNL